MKAMSNKFQEEGVVKMRTHSFSMHARNWTGVITLLSVLSSAGLCYNGILYAADFPSAAADSAPDKAKKPATAKKPAAAKKKKTLQNHQNPQIRPDEEISKRKSQIPESQVELSY